MRANKTVKPTDKKPLERKETRRERRAIQRKMDEYFKLKCYEVDVFDGDETFWIIAIHEAHVEELLLAHDDIKKEDISGLITLNQEQMKQIVIQANEDTESEETTLWIVFKNYEGAGEIICSTMWED